LAAQAVSSQAADHLAMHLAGGDAGGLAIADHELGPFKQPAAHRRSHRDGDRPGPQAA